MVYCVFTNERLAMCYDTEVLIKVFSTNDKAQAYIDKVKLSKKGEYWIEAYELN